MKTAGPNDRIELNGLEAAYAHRGALAWIQLITR